MSVLISCEAGGEFVPDLTCLQGPTWRPPEFPKWISGDRPARYAARRLAHRLSAPLIENPMSLALVDVSRSSTHRSLYSSLTRRWPEFAKRWLLDEIHTPYRQRIRSQISQQLMRSGYLIHISIRSFDPRAEGKMRRADAGLLYDPARQDEVDLCLDWIDEMYDELPMLRVRRNYPRRGTTDSMTKRMRREFREHDYVGVELQLNRAWAGRSVAVRDEVLDGMADCLAEITQACQIEAA